MAGGFIDRAGGAVDRIAMALTGAAGEIGAIPPIETDLLPLADDGWSDDPDEQIGAGPHADLLRRTVGSPCAGFCNGCPVAHRLEAFSALLWSASRSAFRPESAKQGEAGPSLLGLTVATILIGCFASFT